MAQQDHADRNILQCSKSHENDVPYHFKTRLTPVPHARNSGMSHLFLQLEDAIHQRFRCRWAFDELAK